MSEIIAVTQRFSWWGKAAGYSSLVDFFPPNATSTIRAFEGLGSQVSPLQRIFTRNRYREMRTSTVLERSAPVLEKRLAALVRGQDRLGVHFLHVEKNCGTGVRDSLALKGPLIGTVHQPRSWWVLNHLNPGIVGEFDGVIALSRELQEYVDTMGARRSIYIPHGVNTEHFRPAEQGMPRDHSPRILSVGHWLRDFPLLERIVALSWQRGLDWEFEVVLPRWKCEEPEMIRLARHRNVSIRSGLSEGELVEAYQQADLFLLPLVDCVGNNALVEAVSCGLPLVVTDLPAGKDYLRDEFARKVRGEDPGDYIDAIQDGLSGSWNASARTLARSFALEHLAWEHIAQRTADFYGEIGQASLLK